MLGPPPFGYAPGYPFFLPILCKSTSMKEDDPDSRYYNNNNNNTLKLS